MTTIVNTGHDHAHEDDEETGLSNVEMVERYWNLLPTHIQAAIDETGVEEAKRLDMMSSGFLSILSNRQILARAAFARVLHDIKSLGELPKDIKPNIRRELEDKAMANRAGMLRGGDIMTLKKNNSPYPGIDIIFTQDGKNTKRLIGAIEAALSLSGSSPIMKLDQFAANTSRLSLPRGAYNVTLGGMHVYSDYKGEWRGDRHHYRNHYDNKNDKYFEAVGCPDCDQGPDLRNAKSLLSLDHSEIVAIHGHQPPALQEGYGKRYPVFYQNPNFLPDGTKKSGRKIPVFYERLCG